MDMPTLARFYLGIIELYILYVPAFGKGCIRECALLSEIIRKIFDQLIITQRKSERGYSENP